jgi:large subunit ribosomal protein L25
MAIIRDMQFDPVSRASSTWTCRKWRWTAPSRSRSPCHVGGAVGVKDTQGILEMCSARCGLCLPGNIPEYLEADITNLAIHDVLTVKDLKVPEGDGVLNDPNQAVVTSAPPAGGNAAPTR